MAQATVQPRAARRSPAEVAVDRVWRFFCSVRAAIYEIAVLALLVLIGTLRGSEIPRWIADRVPDTGGIVRRWYAFDVFHSLPFMFVLTLLAVAIFICTLNRAPAIWHAIAHPTVGTTHGFLRAAEPSAHLASTAAPAELTSQLGAALRSRRYRILTEERGQEIHLYADKHHYAKLGTFPFHLALILILVGGIVGARYGFRENEFIVPEGSVRDVGHGTGLSVRLDHFTDTYQENGMPHEYRSDLVLLKDGKPVKRKSITVNHPLTYGSTVLYQASFGQAVSFRVTDDAGHVLYDDAVPIGILRSSLNPDAPAGFVDLPPLDASLTVIGPDEQPANMPQLDTLHLQSGQMFVQIRPHHGATAGQMPPSAIVGQGEAVKLAGVKIEFVRERRYTLLQVARNPGIPIFFVAAFLLVGGLAVTFYFPHRRVRAIVSPAPAGSLAHLAPLARRDWSGQRDFHRLLEDLQTRLGPEVAILTMAGVDRGARPVVAVTD